MSVTIKEKRIKYKSLVFNLSFAARAPTRWEPRFTSQNFHSKTVRRRPRTPRGSFARAMANGGSTSRRVDPRNLSLHCLDILDVS